jgi:hypothetical protein
MNPNMSRSIALALFLTAMLVPAGCLMLLALQP